MCVRYYKRKAFGSCYFEKRDLHRPREAIEQIPLPHNKKGMQSFMGTINFMRRFLPDFAQIVKPLQQMVKQSVQFKWIDSEKDAFNKIKKSIAHPPSLKIPNFEKDSILYTFSSNDSLETVLTQKEEGEMSTPCRL